MNFNYRKLQVVDKIVGNCTSVCIYMYNQDGIWDGYIRILVCMRRINN